MLKRLDPSLGGLRFGVTQHMTGDKIAPLFRLGPFVVGRRVVGDLEPGRSVLLRERSRMLGYFNEGVNAQLEFSGNVTIYEWSDDSLGIGSKVLREVTSEEVNKDPELRRYIYNYNPERR